MLGIGIGIEIRIPILKYPHKSVGASPDAPASKPWPLERPHLCSHAGAWERAKRQLIVL